jgi:nanoRNase/pAp phosphatase (c-di-AMP/oligoRNAs hydrolase)
MQTAELTPKQQTVELLRQAESVLVVTGREPNIDQIASVFALQQILTRLGKKSYAVVTDSIPTAAEKLMNLDHVSRTLDGVRDFIVSLDLSHVEVDKLKYDIVEGRLDVTITPAAGNFTPEDARFDYGSYQFDLVVVVGVHKLTQIDRLLESNPTIFDGLHLINIDYHRINENYGSVNFVDTTASSVSEMLIGTIESLGQGMIDADIATALLSGVMSATNRFTTSSTTPKTMTIAAQLLSGGARQQEVVRELYSAGAGVAAPVKKARKISEVISGQVLADLQAVSENMKTEQVQNNNVLQPGGVYTPEPTQSQQY